MPTPLPRPDHACAVRDVLDRIGDAWSVLVLLSLGDGALRFNELRRTTRGVSQRMLAVTLRHLERDGFVSREVLPTAPPRVLYALTPLGASLRSHIVTLHAWAETHQPEVRAARAGYDARPRAEAA